MPVSHQGLREGSMPVSLSPGSQGSVHAQPLPGLREVRCIRSSVLCPPSWWKVTVTVGGHTGPQVSKELGIPRQQYCVERFEES